MRCVLIAILVSGLVACGSADDGTDAPAGGVYYGTCDHRPPASEPCVDYYCDSEGSCDDPATNGQTTCETGGSYGTPADWTTTACPTTGLVGTCTFQTYGDGRLVNSYYAQSTSATRAVCELAGGIWTPGS